MVNRNVESEIPLGGRGLTYKQNERYLPGEFKQLLNVEVNNDGNIVRRRNFVPCGPTVGYDPDPEISEAYRFVGNFFHGAVIRRQDDKLDVVFPNDSEDRWTYGTNRFGGLDDDETHSVFGPIFSFQFYNRTAYVFQQCADTVLETTQPLLRIHHYTIDGVLWGDIDSSMMNPSNGDWITVNHPGISIPDDSSIEFKNGFMFKERMWIYTQEGLYFSKATDPTVWAVPDGGFFRFPNSLINYVIPTLDSIYVICDSEIYSINYGIDPNLDATVRTHSTSVGGDSACIFEGTPYFSKNDELYAIEPNGIRKVMDLRLGIRGYQGIYTNLYAFGDYILLFPHIRIYDNSIFEPDPDEDALRRWIKLALDSKFAQDEVNFSPTLHSLYALNMRNGTIHGIGFNSKALSDSLGEWYAISDILVNPQDDIDNRSNIFFLATKPWRLDPDDTLYMSNTNSVAYYMELSYPNTEETSFQDTLWLDADDTDDEGFFSYSPQVLVEIEGFLPDGLEYNIKKFRNLLIYGKMPSSGVDLLVAYDNSAYQTIATLTDDTVTNANRRPPYPHRIPLMQRARSISLKFEVEQTSIIPEQTDITIEDIRLYWGYTDRGPINQNQDQSSGGLS
jgi:hypothetical protein